MKIALSKPLIGHEERKAVDEVLKSGLLVQGKVTKQLEQKIAQFCKTKYAVAFNSGTAAIHASLYAIGIKPGDEVITTPFTFVASANPILMMGAKPVFVDINEQDFNIDIKKLKKAITKKTRAIIPIDLYGQIYDYRGLRKIIPTSRDTDIKIIEDSCQAIGAKYQDKMAGTLGQIGTFSLYATKNITGIEGGLLVTNNKDYAQKAKMFRHHGQNEDQRYEYRDIGYNYRTTDVNSAIALEQFKKLDFITNKRRENAAKLSRGLKNIKNIILPKEKADFKHVYHQYTIRVLKDRDKLMAYLQKKGVGCNIYYPKPLHLHTQFKKLGYKKGDFPVAEQMAKEVLSLPVHPLVTDKEIDYIISCIKNI
jgi:perosamine synthetase